MGLLWTACPSFRSLQVLVARRGIKASGGVLSRPSRPTASSAAAVGVESSSAGASRKTSNRQWMTLALKLAAGAAGAAGALSQCSAVQCVLWMDTEQASAAGISC